MTPEHEHPRAVGAAGRDPDAGAARQGLATNLAAAELPVAPEVISQELTLAPEHGLHARVAVRIVEAAKRFLPETTVVVKASLGRQAPADSILSILSLGAVRGSALTLEARGPKRKEAFEAVAAVITSEER